MFFRRMHNPKAVVLAAITLSCATLHASSYNSDVRDMVKDVVKEALSKDGRSVYDIPSSLSYCYESALDGATSSIDCFLEEMKSIVLRSEFEDYVDKAIKKRLKEYGLTKSDIRYSLDTKFEEKCRKILAKVSDYSSYYDYVYVHKSDIKSIVQDKIGYSFIQKIKDEKGASWGLGDAIGTIAAGIANLLSSSDDDDDDVIIIEEEPDVPVYYEYEGTPPYNPEIFEEDCEPSAPDWEWD